MSKVIEEGCVEGEEYLNVFMVRKRVSVLCRAKLDAMLTYARPCQDRRYALVDLGRSV